MFNKASSLRSCGSALAFLAGAEFGVVPLRLAEDEVSVFEIVELVVTEASRSIFAEVGLFRASESVAAALTPRLPEVVVTFVAVSEVLSSSVL
jgi:hypothetical protein